eukprot:7581601-Pyramimonas_sp.AAC.1
MIDARAAARGSRSGPPRRFSLRPGPGAATPPRRVVVAEPLEERSQVRWGPPGSLHPWPRDKGAQPVRAKGRGQGPSRGKCKIGRNNKLHRAWQR